MSTPDTLTALKDAQKALEYLLAPYQFTAAQFAEARKLVAEKLAREEYEAIICSPAPSIPTDAELDELARIDHAKRHGFPPHHEL